MARRRTALVPVVALVVALALVGCSPEASSPVEGASGAPGTTEVPSTGPRATAPPARSDAAPPTPPPTTAPPAEPPPPAPAGSVGVPRSISLPAVGVDGATVVDLGLEADGTLETPEDFELAGWWSGGSKLDAAGPTIIAGHVDSTTGPAVFYRLAELDAGDEVHVVDDAGATARFTVTAVEQHPKGAFPTDRVYGPTEGPSLRLITCGGTFDHDERSYRDNVIVYAEPA